MRKYVRLYRRFLAQYLKQLLEYRVDFIIGILSFVFIQASGIVFLTVIFNGDNGIKELMGWQFNDLLLIYAMFQLPRGLDHLFTDNLWMVSYYNRRGTFDKYLTRPIGVLFHVISERLQIEALGELLVGIVLLVCCFTGVKGWIEPVGVTLGFFDVVCLIIFVILGACIYTSIKIITASLSFWTKDSQPIMSTMYEIATFTKQPICIYPFPIRFVLVYVVPFAFTSYFPAAFLLDKANANIPIPTWEPSLLLLQGFITTVVFVLLSLFIWKRGLRRYESAGS